MVAEARFKDSQCAPYEVCAHCGRELYASDLKFQWATDRFDTCKDCFLELCMEMGPTGLADAMGLSYRGDAA